MSLVLTSRYEDLLYVVFVKSNASDLARQPLSCESIGCVLQ